MSTHTTDSKFDDQGHHIVPIKFYVFNLMALIVCMAATIAVSHIDLTSFGNNIIAMLIAVTKAYLVVTIFMGVKWASKLVKIYTLLGFVWVFFLGIMFCDYGTRHLEIEPGWEGQKQLRVTGMNDPVVYPVAGKRAHVEESEGCGGH